MCESSEIDQPIVQTRDQISSPIYLIPMVIFYAPDNCCHRKESLELKKKSSECMRDQKYFGPIVQTADQIPSAIYVY